MKWALEDTTILLAGAHVRAPAQQPDVDFTNDSV